MANMPAICNNCNTAFSVGLSIKNSNVSFSGTTAGPCPNCGGRGHIPDGDFAFFDEIVHVLSAPNRTLSELENLVKILENTKREYGKESEQVVEDIEKEIPELTPFVTHLKKVDYKFWVSILLSTIYFIIPYLTNDKKDIPEIKYEEVISIIHQEDAEKTLNEVLNNQKIGRNEICPCGSHLKYKKCHGAN